MIHAWHEQGVCQSVDPDEWFRETPNRWDPCFKICSTCPVKRECLKQSFDEAIEFGVWGGLSGSRRVELLKSYRSRAKYDREKMIDRLLARLQGEQDERDAQLADTRERTNAKKAAWAAS